jgi:LPS-assembly protein
MLWAATLAVFAQAIATQVADAEERAPMHWSGDKTFWDRKANHVKLIGKAVVNQPGETLTADEIELDLGTRTLDAKGHCVYITSDSVIYGEEMHFNMETRTGTIIGGRVSAHTFTLTGERINKLGEGRFQTHRGEYTTCWDCPNSWAFRGEDVDLEFEGYAYMSNVTAKAKDAPIFWLPYLVVPLKTRRQSGLLFPRFRFGNPGFRVVQPFFWAISRSADMTIGLGHYGGQGTRAELEGRYRLGERSYGTGDFYYLRDETFAARPNRFALSVEQFQELPFGVEQKLRLIESGDNRYPATVGDIPGNGEAYVSSDLIFSHSTNQVSTYVAGRRFRNLLNLDNAIDFDPHTVQVFPTAAVTSNDKIILDSPYLAGGLTLGLSNFTRTEGAFDELPANETFPEGRIIRKATRLGVFPSLYTTLRPWDVVTLTPSAEYRSYFYSFHNELPNLTLGYLLLQADLSTQFERIYSTDDPNAPRFKHLIRPLLTFSLIPYRQQSGDHPFSRQVDYAQKRKFSGFNFDSNDIIPYDASGSYSNYFIPLGRSLSYGFTTQLIRRKGADTVADPAYQRTIELRAGQTYNFRELRQADPKPLSRYFTGLNLSFDKFEATADYYYDPYAVFGQSFSRHIFSGSATYVLDRSMHQSVLSFDRSVSLGYSYSGVGTPVSNFRSAISFSINDYLLPSINGSFNSLTHQFLDWGGGLSFQHPSRCWRFGVTARRYRCVERDLCLDTGIDLSLNLTGSGFGGVSELASAAQSH